jgi:preprotein translocase subunit SecD
MRRLADSLKRHLFPGKRRLFGVGANALIVILVSVVAVLVFGSVLGFAIGIAIGTATGSVIGMGVVTLSIPERRLSS